MDKTIILKNVGDLVQRGELTKSELLEVYERSIQGDTGETMNRQSRISNILYVIGGMVVFLGIWILIGTNWNQLSDVTKILVTLGSAVMLYVSGYLLSRYENLEKISDAFYFVSNLILPLGIFVTMNVAKMDTSSAASHVLAGGIVFAVNLLSYYWYRRNVFLIFNVIFGTWLFFSLTTYLVGGRPFADWTYISYRWLAIGLTHMILGYALVNSDRNALTPALYCFGVIEFLTAALCLGKWSPDQNLFWELIYPGLVFGILFLSVYLKSRAFLVFGTLYLVAFVLKITGEYFTSGFGWALSLVIVGFCLMAIGYGAFYINKKYIRQ